MIPPGSVKQFSRFSAGSRPAVAGLSVSCRERGTCGALGESGVVRPGVRRERRVGADSALSRPCRAGHSALTFAVSTVKLERKRKRPGSRAPRRVDVVMYAPVAGSVRSPSLRRAVPYPSPAGVSAISRSHAHAHCPVRGSARGATLIRTIAEYSALNCE